MKNDIVVCVDVTPRWTFFDDDDPLKLLELDAIYTISQTGEESGEPVVRVLEVDSGAWSYMADRFRLVYRIPDVSALAAHVSEEAQAPEQA